MTTTRTPCTVAAGASTAAAEPVPFLKPWHRTRTARKRARYPARDRAPSKREGRSALDARNYRNAKSVNRGDQPIIDSITAKIGDHIDRVEFIHKNWRIAASNPKTCAMVPDVALNYATGTSQPAGADRPLKVGFNLSLLHAYQQLGLHIGGMLPSRNLATSCGGSCIGQAYDVRHYEFFDLMQMPAQCVSAVHFDIANTLTVFNPVRADLPAIQDRTGALRDAIEQELDRFVRQVVELIDPHAGVAHA